MVSSGIRREKLFYIVVELKNCVKLNCQEINQRDAAAHRVNIMGIPFLVNQVLTNRVDAKGIEVLDGIKKPIFQPKHPKLLMYFF